MSAAKLHQQYADAENAYREASQALIKTVDGLADARALHKKLKKQLDKLRERVRTKLQKADR